MANIKLDDETQEKILDSLRAGTSRLAAASEAGITDRTLRNWLEKGARDDDAESPFARFAAAVELAEAGVERRMVNVIIDAAETRGDIRAAQYWLERRRREAWGTVNESNVTIHAPECSPERAAALVRAAFGEVARPADTESDEPGCL